MAESEATTVEYYESLVTEFIQTFKSFLQASQLYDQDNDHMKRITRNLRSILRDCFTWRNPISLTVVQEQLFFEELPIDSQAPAVAELIDQMLDRLIRRITIHRKVEPRELFALVEILNVDPIVVRDRGGPHMMLLEDLNVENILLSELSDISGNEILESENWQSTLTKAGIDLDDVTRYMLGPARLIQLVEAEDGDDLSVRGSRMLKREFFQLIEYLMHPEILAQMILDLASVETEEGSMVDPAEILRIVTHTENTLLLRSNFSIEDISQKLSEAFVLWDLPTRTAVLAEALRMRAMGLLAPNLELYQFTAEEWAEALCDLGMDDSGKDWLSRVFLRETAWEEIDPLYQAVFDERDYENDALREKIAHRVRQFESFPVRMEIPLYELNEVLFAGQEAYSKGSAARQVGVLKSQLKSHIEAGYTHTVLGLLRFERDERRVRKIAENYFEQVQQILGRNHFEAVDYLYRLQGVLSERGDSTEDVIGRWLHGDGRDFVSGFLKKTKNLQFADNLRALKNFLPLLQQAGEEGIREMLDHCWFDNVHTKMEDILSLVEPIRQETIAILEGYLDEHHLDFSPHRFHLGFGLYMAIRKTEGAALIEQCANSKNGTLRMATLIRLSRSNAPDVAIPIFRQRLFESGWDTPIDERIVAAYGLGVMKDEESADALYKMARGPRFVGKQEHDRLRLASLYAFACIRGREVDKAVAKLYLRITKQRLAVLLPWKKRQKEKDRI